MMIERISNFRMVRTISESDRGALLHAVSEKSGERVAVRLQRGEYASAELLARWQRAVQVSRLLGHPAVVRLIQAGQLPDGSVYLIQEQLPGENLAARLASRPRLPMNELLRLGRQVATVLVAAHARGIVHSALRPEVLQLVPDPEAIGGERVKITDWGLSRVPPGPTPPLLRDKDAPPLPSVMVSDPSSTQPFELDAILAAADHYPAPAPPLPLDAPTYVSPEQCRTGTVAGVTPDKHPTAADPAVVTDRVDVYALGVMLFQMASGQLPFSGRAPSELMAMHIAALPPKLEQRGISGPVGLSTLVATMLIKDPTARPSMREVEERLQQLAAQQQLAQTMTPGMRDATTAQSASAVVPQKARAAEPPAARPPRKGLWVLTAALGLAALFGLWQALGSSLDPKPAPGGPTADLTPGSPVTAAGEPPHPSAVLPVNPTAPAVAPLPGASAPSAAPPDPTAVAPTPLVTPTPAPAAVGAPTAAPPIPATAGAPAAAPPIPAPSTTSAPTAAPPTAAPSTASAPAAVTPTPVTPTAAPPASADPAAPLPANPAAAPLDPSAPAREPGAAALPAATRPASPPSAATRPGIPPLRDLSVSSVKATVSPPPAAKKPAPGKPPRAAASAAEIHKQLLIAQTAYTTGDYATAIASATASLPHEPEAAALILGQSACAANNLTLVNRAYASLRSHPPTLTKLTTECKKHSIELGVSGQFVRTKLR